MTGNNSPSDERRMTTWFGALPHSVVALCLPVGVSLSDTSRPDSLEIPDSRDVPVGAAGDTEVLVLIAGMKMLEIPLSRRFFAGVTPLGIAPCTHRSLSGAIVREEKESTDYW